VIQTIFDRRGCILANITKLKFDFCFKALASHLEKSLQCPLPCRLLSYHMTQMAAPPEHRTYAYDGGQSRSKY
jgi:hypothetical protein